jgi:hypothetical protein
VDRREEAGARRGGLSVRRTAAEGRLALEGAELSEAEGIARELVDRFPFQSEVCTRVPHLRSWIEEADL